MTDLIVPRLGDACLIYLLGDELALSDVAVKHVDPNRQELLATLASPPVRGTRGWQPVMSVAHDRQPLTLSPTSTALLLGGATRAPRAVIRELGLKTALLLPVVDQHHERALAVIVLLSARSRNYGPRGVRLAEDLTTRFALALEAAEMYRTCRMALEEGQESLATTVHDLMSPLTVIKGTAQRLRRVQPRLADPTVIVELRNRLDAIDAATNRMASALTALLQTTRVEATARPKGAFQTTDLVALAAQAVAEQQLIAKHHSIRMCDAPTELKGRWNADQLERMLGNLIGNAVKYSPRGTSVEVSLADDTDADGSWAVLRVADKGLGIPAGELPFVFEPFRRGSNVGGVVGTGLGLASVWQTVKTHDGRLWLDSQEGEGTCVTVRLPLGR
jgi:signal transduction histidine kinase